MQIPLDFSFDTHFVYVDQCYENTLNIVVRAKVNAAFQETHITEAATALVQKHPYIAAKVVACDTEEETNSYHLAHLPGSMLGHNIRKTSIEKILATMQQTSPMREYRFDIYNGELAHIEVLHDDNSSIIELSCAHLVGDVTAIIMLFSDLLAFLDQAISGHINTPSAQTRLTFNEKRYAWKITQKNIDTLPFPDNTSINNNKWPKLSFDYKRGQIPITTLTKTKEWLQHKNINGKVTDVFYYLIERLYHKKYGTDLNFLAVFSFRHLLENEIDKTNINTSAIFSALEVPKDLLDSPKDWIEKSCWLRNHSITTDGVMGMIHFLRCLNYSMRDKSTNDRRALINSYIPMDKCYAINNFGSVDKLIINTSNFQIIDIDIQDGVPAQEIRIFGHNDALLVNPMLDPEGPISADALLTDLSSSLTDLIQS